MAAGIPVMSEIQWARIVAKAYLDGTTDDLVKDPKSFVDGVRTSNDPPGMFLPTPVRLLSLDYSGWSGPPSTWALLLSAIFQGSTQQELHDLFTSGNFRGKEVALSPGSWIDPYGLTRVFQHDANAISLKNWMRIYAYIWHEIKAGNTTIREHFEEDPARTLQDTDTPPLFNDQIINGINALSPSNLQINYAYKTTPLLTLGDPPPPGTLTDIRNNSSAMGYRHRMKLTC